MKKGNEYKPFERLVKKFEPQGKLLRTWRLNGGVSAQVTALEIEQLDGQTKKWVVRRHGAIDFQRNPHIAADEFKLLQILQSAGLVVPKPYHVDESGEIFARPYLIIEYIDGKTEFAPSNLEDYILLLATTLAQIHRVESVSFLPKQDALYTEYFRQRPAKSDEQSVESRVQKTLAAVCPLTQVNKSVLLHGDFWSGNILWKDDQLAAIIDWEDAAIGDPLADLANSRLEILWAIGIEAMQRFTDHYQSIMTTVDFTHLPYWDLYAAWRTDSKFVAWAEDEITEKRLREQHDWFVTQALEKLSLR